MSGSICACAISTRMSCTDPNEHCQYSTSKGVGCLWDKWPPIPLKVLEQALRKEEVTIIYYFHSQIHILMLIKRRPAQFTSFVENKYRHEHVMIINLYIVSHILYDRHLLHAFYEAFAHA